MSALTLPPRNEGRPALAGHGPIADGPQIWFPVEVGTGQRGSRRARDRESWCGESSGGTRRIRRGRIQDWRFDLRDPGCCLTFEMNRRTLSFFISPSLVRRRQELAPNRDKRPSRGCRGVIGPVPQPLLIRSVFSCRAASNYTRSRKLGAIHVSDGW